MKRSLYFSEKTVSFCLTAVRAGRRSMRFEAIEETYAELEARIAKQLEAEGTRSWWVLCSARYSEGVVNLKVF